MGLFDALFGARIVPLTDPEAEALRDYVEQFFDGSAFSGGTPTIPRSEVEIVHTPTNQWKLHEATDTILKIEVPVKLHFKARGVVETAHPVITLNRQTLEIQDFFVPRSDLLL